AVDTRVSLAALTTGKRQSGASQSDVAGPAHQRTAFAWHFFAGVSQRVLAGVYRCLQCALCGSAPFSRVSASAARQRRRPRSNTDALRAAHVIEKPDALLQQRDLSDQNQALRLHHAPGTGGSA